MAISTDPAGASGLAGCVVGLHCDSYAGLLSISLVIPTSLAVALKLLGFEFPLNFARPFLSRNPPDFWQRWHITLSRGCGTICSCRLAGEEKGRFVLYRNMLVVMVLVGLWHGANWTFVAWGAYHGILLIGYRLFDRATVGTPIDKVMKKRWFVPFSVGLMFAAFVLSVAFFRAEDSPGQRICLKCAVRFPACNWRIPADDWDDRAHFHFSVSGGRAGTQSIY